eukprot:SAG11_NODE_247_length_11679_cov_6.170898_14_plen_60_part_00
MDLLIAMLNLPLWPPPPAPLTNAVDLLDRSYAPVPCTILIAMLLSHHYYTTLTLFPYSY